MSYPPEADLRRLFDRAPVGFYRATVDGELIYANPALVAMLGYQDVDDVLGLRLADDLFVDAAERRRVLAAFSERGVIDGVTARWRTRGGAPLTVRLYGFAVQDERGGGFQVTVVDVTAQHAAEAEVDTQRALAERRGAALAMLVDQVPALIGIVDPSLRVISVEGSGLRALGLTAAQVRGKPVSELVPADSVAVVHLRAALAGSSAHFEWAATERTLAVSVAPLREGDAVVGAVAVAVDVTAARRLEARVQAAERAESIGLLAGGVAHDFNNLLVAVLGNADLALLDLPAGPPRAAVESIRTAALRAGELTAQLLAVAGRSMISVSSVELRPLVVELVELLRPTFAPDVAIEVDLAAEASPVRADATQLRQVLLNLLTNARDAIAGAGRTGAIKVRARAAAHDGAAADADVITPPAGAYVVIEVADDGPGMDDATRRRVFEPFFTTKARGTGLGLAAVHGIVRGHGAGLRVDSGPGRGTRFELWWPAADEVAHAGAGRRVLVADDEPMVRDVVCRMLEDVGYVAVAAADGAAAVERAAAAPFDAVLLDLHMPGRTGAETLAALRALRPALPVIVCSGRERDLVDVPGASATLAKPFHFEQLLAALATALAKRP